MKRILFFTNLLIILLSIFTTGYGAVKDELKVKFTEKEVSGTGFKEITIAPYYTNRSEESNEKYTFYIYLPSGFMVEAETASYVADRNGEYPFTIYDNGTKKTFTYKVKNIGLVSEDEDDRKNDNIYFEYGLKYDYEKKQIFFSMQLDKMRTVTTPAGKTVSNEVNYYISSVKDNVPFSFSVDIDKKVYDYRVIKSGEYYLLISISQVNYNDYSTVVEYFGYNFTNNLTYTVNPPKDLYDDNGNYVVLVKSENSQHVFSFDIDGIDYRRPSVDSYLSSDDTLTLEIGEDFGLDYLISFDGKYYKLNGTSAEYNHKTKIKYNGDYIFTVVDKKGNRTAKKITLKSMSKLPRRFPAIETAVHDFKHTDTLFENIGIEYKEENDEKRHFKNVLPAYMSGKSPENFNPDAPVSRAEMVTIFCRLNNLPYDTGAQLKSVFTDIENHWARDYIAMGSSKKYVSGYKDKTFKPDNSITRAEFCQMLTKISAYKSLLNALPASENYIYTDIGNHWAKKEILTISNRNLLLGIGDHFSPDAAITRGEVVHAVNMLYGYNPSYLELAHISTLYNKYYSFRDISGHKYYNDIIISVIGMYREKIN